MRGGRGLRDEFSAFHASAYPQLAAQTLAITADAEITRAAAATTLSRVWRSWPSLRGTADVLVRARWTAVLVAAQRESTAPPRRVPAGDAVRTAVEEFSGVAVAADVVVVAALQRLPRVQRRALVLHYMGGVSVKHLAELSGSSAEHVELLLDDGFTALADSLEWPAPDALDPAGPDLSFDWVAEAVADVAARLPAQILAPPPTALLRNAAVVRWSVRAVPVAAAAACAALVAAIAQPVPAPVHLPAVYAQNGNGPEVGAPAYATRTDPAAERAVSEPVADGLLPGPSVRKRSIALTSLLDTAGRDSDARGARVERNAPPDRVAPGSSPRLGPPPVAERVSPPPEVSTPGGGTEQDSPAATADGPTPEPARAAAPGAEVAKGVPSGRPTPAKPPPPIAASAAVLDPLTGAGSVAPLAAGAAVVGGDASRLSERSSSAEPPPSGTAAEPLPPALSAESLPASSAEPLAAATAAESLPASAAEPPPSRSSAESLPSAGALPPPARSRSESPTTRPHESQDRVGSGLLATGKRATNSRTSMAREHAAKHDPVDQRGDRRSPNATPDG